MRTLIVTALALILSACATIGEVRRNELLDVSVRFHGEDTTGSGVVVSSNERGTLILTAAHVAAGENKKVMFVGDTTVYEATFLKANDEMDIALMHTNATGKSVARMFKGDHVQRMENVYAVGSGMSMPIHMTQGFSSATIGGEILFTAPVTSGNSGGGLFIKNGIHFELIGIVTKVASRPEPVMAGPGLVVGVVMAQVSHISFATAIAELRSFLTW